MSSGSSYSILDPDDILWLNSVSDILHLNYQAELRRFEKLKPNQRKEYRLKLNNRVKNCKNKDKDLVNTQNNPASSDEENNSSEIQKQTIRTEVSDLLGISAFTADCNKQSIDITQDILSFNIDFTQANINNNCNDDILVSPPIIFPNVDESPQNPLPESSNPNIETTVNSLSNPSSSPCEANSLPNTVQITPTVIPVTVASSIESNSPNMNGPAIIQTRNRLSLPKSKPSSAVSFSDTNLIEANIQSIEKEYYLLHSQHLARSQYSCSHQEEELLDLLQVLKRKLHSSQFEFALQNSSLYKPNSTFITNSKHIKATQLFTSVRNEQTTIDDNNTNFSINSSGSRPTDEPDNILETDETRKTGDKATELNNRTNNINNDKKITYKEIDYKDSANTMHYPSQYKDENQLFWSRRHLKVNAQWYHVASLSVCSILSGSYFSWNAGLVAGFGSFTIASALTGAAYMLMCLCLAEMASALPFSGGSYGFTRATMGPVLGMIVGLCESLEYILTTAVNTLIVSTICTELLQTSPSLEPLWQLLSYIIAVAIHLHGGKLFWKITLCLTVLDIVVLVFYWFGVLQYINVDSNSAKTAGLISDDSATGNAYFLGGMNSFLTVLPISLWWYTGIETVPLSCEETIEPRTNIPKAMITSFTLVIFASFFTLFICCFIPFIGPGSTGSSVMTIIQVDFPLIDGFNRLFNNPGYNYPLLRLLLLPGIFASAYGFIYSYGRQIFALSRSGFIPKFLSLTSSKNHTPYAALIVGSFIGYFICLGRIFFDTNDKTYQFYIYNCMLIVALTTYIFQVSCFIILRIKYPMLSRQYRSPVGIPGAVISLLIFSMCFISLCGWAEKIYTGFICLFIYLALGLLYYYFYSSKRLVLSPEEKFALFMVYTVNAIRKQRNQQQHQQQQEPIQ